MYKTKSNQRRRCCQKVYYTSDPHGLKYIYISDDGRRRSSYAYIYISPMRMSSHGSPDRKAWDKQLEMEREKELLHLDENEGVDSAE